MPFWAGPSSSLVNITMMLPLKSLLELIKSFIDMSIHATLPFMSEVPRPYSFELISVSSNGLDFHLSKSPVGTTSV